MTNPQTIMTLRKITGCSLVDCKRALEACDYNEGVAFEYLRLKGTALNRKKCVCGRWMNWTEKDYVEEAKRIYEKSIT